MFNNYEFRDVIAFNDGTPILVKNDINNPHSLVFTTVYGSLGLVLGDREGQDEIGNRISLFMYTRLFLMFNET